MAQAPDQNVSRPSIARVVVASPVRCTFATSLSIQGLNVVTGILLARTLGPNDRGTLAAVLLWPMVLAAVGSLGLTEAVTYFTARASERARDLLGTVLALSCVTSAGLIAVGLVLEPLVLRDGHQDSVSLGRLFLLFIPLNLLTLGAMGVLNGLRRYGWFNILRFLVIALTACGLICIGLRGQLTVRNASFVYLGANAMTLCIALGVALRSAGGASSKRSLFRPLLAFGVKSHLASVSSVANERADQLLISAFLAPRLLGLYVVAVTLTSLTNVIGASVEMVALSAVASHANVRAGAAAARRYIAMTAIASVVVSVPMIAIAPGLLRVLFGREFDSAAGAARVLLIAAILLSTNRAIGAVLRGLGKPLDAGVGETIALAVTGVALPILLWRMGILGAAFASLIAYATACAWNGSRCARLIGEPRWYLLAWPRVPRARGRRPQTGSIGLEAGE